jgi:hypothetical protein
MRKIIIGLSGLVILSLVVILFVNAENGTKEINKPSSEVKMNCAKSPSAAPCAMMGETKSATCDPAKCKEMGCDPAKCKEGICDPATCKINCAGMKSEMAKSASPNCPATCPMAKLAR